jgi:pyruvate formate lyase activating enzyme
MTATQELVFDTKRYAINDGPGVRVTIFLKGCPLNCKWCHNPESISPRMEKMFSASKCIGALSCINECPENALSMTPDKGVVTDFDLCTMCSKCAESCPSGAMEMVAQHMDVASIIETIYEERQIIEQSGGGVTFSGGEPLMHHEFLIEALEACRAEGFHCTVDTSGLTSRSILLDVAKRTDHWLYDLKSMDPEVHLKWTGVRNEKILANLVALAKTGASISVRMPLIEGVNADDANIIATAQFVRALEGDRKQVNLLPYHKIAENKYEKLGRQINLEGMSEPSIERQQEVVAIFESHGLEAMVGG